MIHGYPPGKGLKVVAQASSSTNHMPITQHQYVPLINTLNKQPRGEHLTHAAFLTGPWMNKPLVIGGEVNGLYVLDTSSTISFTAKYHVVSSQISNFLSTDQQLSSCNVYVSNTSPELWHFSMRHIYFNQL
ncbi:hypothetical protein V2J09_005509 [Rumex salicifolius]